MRSALTLVELLAGLVVLGTLLTGVVVARGRFLDQLGDAEKKLRATQALEAMLSQWLALRSDALPVPGSGWMPGMPDHQWRTRWIADAAATELSTRIVRVEVVGTRSAQLRAARPLMSIDFVIRPEPPATQPAAGIPATEAPR